ncbi:hypothetical protein JAAARDRAFT_31731 [Jaapia argillacea MUCL 33604]|uniref:PPP4R2-domain-containing protein n=1 Tax=Jaapia argillacea MUCL 33604 TaxID=933084 RepID=A0A067Q1A1_9AGAM|nr:hypothetical protein JAAARDRAFT_31731 [Jaapia argillacea MUCL 33604]
MNATDTSYAIASDFEWLPDYDTLLEQIASTDVVDSEWTRLRDIIKYKIEKNIAQFLVEQEQPKNETPIRESPPPAGGLRLPPFTPRLRDESNPNEAPKASLTSAEAEEFKTSIFAQLHDFESNPPFTIQRVCELCLHPQQHYKSVGKYLRAVEKSLLVTSTWDAFPQVAGNQLAPGPPSIPLSTPLPTRSAPATPMFSPIPFLHEDARRSKSRSPPPSPLALAAAGEPGQTPKDTPAMLGPHDTDQKALGLVDELDDPSPGHMSDHPTALSAVTDLQDGSRPLIGSLGERSVRSTDAGDAGQGSDDMELDDTDKENKG